MAGISAKQLSNKKPKKEMTLIGEALFNMDELMKTSMSILKSPISNSKNPSLEKKMGDEGINSRIVLRYEEIEQTNDQVTLQFKLVEFEAKGNMIYKLYRNRSLGEFVLMYTSEKRRNNPDGALFKECEFPVKELVRNDLERLIKLEVYSCKKRGINELIGEVNITIHLIKNEKLRTFSCLKNKNLIGKVQVISLKEWNSY